MKKNKKGEYVLVKENGDREPRIVRRQFFKLSDIGVVIVCVVLALLVWIYVVNINDTDVTKSVLVKLEILGLEELEDKGLMAYGYESLMAKGVTITVQGSNRDLRKYEDNEYHAKLDLSAIDGEGEHDYSIITNIPGAGAIKLVGTDAPVLTIRAFDRAETTVPLRVHVPPTSNFSWTAEGTSEITIWGPREMIEKVSYSRFSVEGILEESKIYTSGFTLQYFDSNDQEVTSDFAKIEYSESSDINVKINIRKEKEIPVVVIVSDMSDSVPYALSVNTIKISGEPKEVDKIERYIIEFKKDEVQYNLPIQHTLSASQFGHESIAILHEGVINVTFSTPVTLPEISTDTETTTEDAKS